MATRAQIQEAVDAGGLLQVDNDWLIPAIRQTSIYSDNYTKLSEFDVDLRALEGDVVDYRGPYIKAVIGNDFEPLGPNQVELAGGRNAVFFNLAENRELMAKLVLNILYPDLALKIGANAPSATAVGTMYAGCRCGLCGCYPCTCYP